MRRDDAAALAALAEVGELGMLTGSATYGGTIDARTADRLTCAGYVLVVADRLQVDHAHITPAGLARARHNRKEAPMPNTATAKPAGRLSDRQRAVLAAVKHYPGITGPEIVQRLAAAHVTVTPESAAQTASSLVRRGLVEKSRTRGIVHYAPARPSSPTPKAIARHLTFLTG